MAGRGIGCGAIALALALGLSPGAGATVARRARARTRTDSVEDEYRADVASARTAIEAHLFPLTLTVEIHVVDHLEGGVAKTDLLDAAGHAVASGPGTVCSISFTRPPPDTPAANIASVAAHETFHCFQFQAIGGSASDLPHWIIEGQASWVGLTIGAVPRTSRVWSEWLQNFEKPLYERDYDAIGFYGVLDGAGIDPWSVLVPMLRAANSDDALAVATGGQGPAFVSTIGQQIARIPELGPAWKTHGPGVIPDTRSTRSVDVAPGSTTRVEDTLAAHSARAYDVAPTGSVLRIRSDAPFGAVGFEGGGGEHFTGPYDRSFCIADACTCAGGRSPSGPELADGAGGTVGVAVGAAGTHTDVVTRLTTYRMRDYCRHHRPAACFPGTYHLSDQTLAPEATRNLGGLTLSGGIGGRSIELRADGSYAVHDDGTDPVVVSGTISGISVTGTGRVRADAGGTYAVAGDTVTFTGTSFSVTDASISVTVSGVTVNQVVPPESIRYLYGWNGPAGYTCSGSTLTLTFPLVTFVLQRV